MSDVNLSFHIVANKGNVKRKDRSTFKTELVTQPKLAVRVLRRPNKTENPRATPTYIKHEEVKEVKPNCDQKLLKAHVHDGFAEHLDSCSILKRLQENQLNNERGRQKSGNDKLVWLDSHENKFISISDVDDKASVSDSDMSFT